MHIGDYDVYFGGEWKFDLMTDCYKCCSDCGSLLEWRMHIGPIGIQKYRKWLKRKI